MGDKYVEAIEVLQDKIREIFLRNSKVREFELKDGAKVGYRVIGTEEGEKAIKELSTLYPAQQGEVVASGVVRIQTDMQWIGSAYIGVGMRGKLIKYKGKKVELILKEKRWNIWKEKEKMNMMVQ